MEENQCIRNIIERQSPAPEVQKHSYPAGAGGGDARSLLVVLKGTDRVGAVQAPGFGVMSELAVAPCSTPAHVFVADPDGNPSLPGPLHLPVAAPSHPSSAQHLGPAAEALRVVRVGLGLRARGRPSATVREAQIRVGCVRVQGDIVVIWKSENAQCKL